MANYDLLTENLKKGGYEVSRFATAAQAAQYIDSKIDGTTVGIGGSVTVEEMGLYEMLSAHNTVYWHWREEDAEATRRKAVEADVYISSVNGIAETGEIVNIDGSGNRLAATIYGHSMVFFVVGSNKIVPDADQAMWRARNIAAPKNARRLGCQTPCAIKGDKCYDCSSPQRICKAAVTLWAKPNCIGNAEVVLIEESLGY